MIIPLPTSPPISPFTKNTDEIIQKENIPPDKFPEKKRILEINLANKNKSTDLKTSSVGNRNKEISENIKKGQREKLSPILCSNGTSGETNISKVQGTTTLTTLVDSRTSEIHNKMFGEHRLDIMKGTSTINFRKKDNDKMKEKYYLPSLSPKKVIVGKTHDNTKT